ncbi:hypothetical protein [Rhizobium sp. IMFF44]|uniref:hypothetical protein n=1 Tax=Rhizobium sp. IMFF44 TaxID=3342350 RepID=UPI0035B9F6AE
MGSATTISLLSLWALVGAASGPLRSEIDPVGNPLKVTCQYLNYYAETAPNLVNNPANYAFGAECYGAISTALDILIKQKAICVPRAEQGFDVVKKVSYPILANNRFEPVYEVVRAAAVNLYPCK